MTLYLLIESQHLNDLKEKTAEIRRAVLQKASKTIGNYLVSTSWCKELKDNLYTELTGIVNEDIVCTHGRLYTTAKKVRSITPEAWEQLTDNFDVIPVKIDTSPVVYKCKLCKDSEKEDENKKKEMLNLRNNIKEDVSDFFRSFKSYIEYCNTAKLTTSSGSYRTKRLDTYCVLPFEWARSLYAWLATPADNDRPTKLDIEYCEHGKSLLSCRLYHLM